MGLGAAVVLPLVALTLWALPRLGAGGPPASLVECVRLAFGFAGIAAVVTAGGLGRAAAHASLLDGGHALAVRRAMRGQVVASAGLAVLAAIAGGHLASEPGPWIAFALAGAVTGVPAGALIGAACGAPARSSLPAVPQALATVARAIERARRVSLTMPVTGGGSGPIAAGDAAGGAAGDAARPATPTGGAAAPGRGAPTSGLGQDP